MKRNGFTLVEMLIVVGILGILMAVLLGTMSGSGDSAQAAKCLANMKNLATAVQSAGLASGYYPAAGATETLGVDVSQGKKNVKMNYGERQGWISWASQGTYPAQSHQSPAPISLYTSDDDEALFALTNGALWKYVGGNSSIFVCPLHAKKEKNVHWSYLMNAYFGWSADPNHSYSQKHRGIQYGHFTAADRTLLFGEVPFQGAGDWFPSGNTGSMETDAILQYKGCNTAPTTAGKSRRDGQENIGGNHKSGKHWIAHLVYADGHVEKLRVSSGKGESVSAENLRELTTWLCTGKSYSFINNQFEELK